MCIGDLFIYTLWSSPVHVTAADNTPITVVYPVYIVNFLESTNIEMIIFSSWIGRKHELAQFMKLKIHVQYLQDSRIEN